LAAEPIPRTSIEALMQRYDALLFDAYGVLVHATGALPGARETIARLNRTGKPYAILTNDASKVPETAAPRYQGFGLDVPVDRILSSGLLLRDYFERHELHGSHCAVLGTADSKQFVERAGGSVVPTDSDFDVLVAADENGYEFVAQVDAAITSLFRSIERGKAVRLVLPNPDLIFPHGENSFGMAAGSVALIIEAALRRRFPQRDDLVFDRLGKPQPDLYEAALARFGTRNAVMIGDQLETDIAGALSCNIDCTLIATGVAVVNSVTAAASIRPTYWMPSLRDG
jgi:HAD superfamily hydrolase (TIGR01450 family)